MNDNVPESEVRMSDLTEADFKFAYRPGDVDVTGFGTPDSFVCVWRDAAGHLRWSEKGSLEKAEAVMREKLNSGKYDVVPG